MAWIIAEQIDTAYVLHTTGEPGGQRVYGPTTHDGAYNLGAWLQGRHEGVTFAVRHLQPEPSEYHRSESTP